MTHENKEMDGRSIGEQFNQTSARNENTFRLMASFFIREILKIPRGFRHNPASILLDSNWD
jgi:hypothetical protein